MSTVNIAPSTVASVSSTPFVNEAFVDFTTAENKRAMQAALVEVENNLGREYDLIIGGKRLQTVGKIVRQTHFLQQRQVNAGRLDP